MNLKDHCNHKFIEFSNYEGSQHIASEFAVYKLIEIVKKFNVVHVLEIGLGIGYITGTILEYLSEVKYWGTESNRFCLNSLKLNLSVQDYERLTISESIEYINSEIVFDLIIIDGIATRLSDIRRNIAERGIIGIEGDRSSQVDEIKKTFPKAQLVHLISLEKNDPLGNKNSSVWQGGLKVVFINPTLRQKLFILAHKFIGKGIYFRRKYIKR